MKQVFLKRHCNDCKIVIPENATVVEKTAAEELKEYIKRSLDTELEIVSESLSDGKCIFVGHTEYADEHGIKATSCEHWIIKLHNGNLILTGGVKRTDRGIIYSAYHFLEDFLGVRWWNSFEENVLTLDELSLDSELFVEGIPAFPFRKPLMNYYCGINEYPQIPRTRTNVLDPVDDGIPERMYHPDVRKYGEVMSMSRPHHVHVMSRHFPADKYFDKHPEWWAWNKMKGEHLRNGHYCFSNEGFFDALVARLLFIIGEDLELAKKTGVEPPCYYSLSLDDKDADYFFCQCDKCSKILEKSGYSGYVIQFVNRVAREINKYYPSVKFENLAYVVFTDPPKDDTLPDKNVIIRLAADRSDISHGITTPANRVYMRWLKQWSDICKKSGSELHIWQYMYNIQTNYPMPLFYGLQDSVRAFLKHGVTGIFAETQHSMADVWDLNKYVFTHLLEDPDVDVDALVRDFCTRYYGKAGDGVVKYLEILREAMNRNMVHCYCCCEDSPFNYIDAKAAVEGYAALDEADRALGDSEPYRSRFNWLRKHLDGVILNRYFDLKRLAESEGLVFDFDRALLKKRVVHALEEYLTKPTIEYRRARIEDEIKYYSSLPDTEEVLTIPEEITANPEDVYQFPMRDIIKLVETGIRDAFGFSEEKDETASVSSVLKVSYDGAKGSQADFIMKPTSKHAEDKKPLYFSLYQENAVVDELTLFREDFEQNGYKLYKIGSLDNIKDYADSSLIVYGYGFLSIKISGIAAIFPMNSCDVYLSMKPSGELYGGRKGDENAVFMDRLIIVRR
ncbi:MAG: DUF4838 domain-containing protein [Clostridia bacterium]|nr:DUF4838 domain-containing protein [Clostridia bacterium]